VSCTEVWLQITGETGKEIQLIRDDKEVDRFTLTASPMTIIDDSLQINTSYNYQLIRTDNGEKSSAATATTLDTTGHNFTWEEYTFGDQTSTLRDVAVIDANNIWAVGDIYINDTTENGYTRYNAVHWDGNKWELKRITVEFRGNQTALNLEGVSGFSETDIWFTGSLPVFGDGNTWTVFDLRTTVDPNLDVTKLWGNNPDNMNFIGRQGSFAVYNNKTWQKVETGTETTLLDIYGEGDNVFIAGYEDFNPSVLLRYKDGKVTKVVEEQTIYYDPERISGGIKSVWVKRNHLFTLTWDDLFRSSVDTKGEGESFWGGNPEIWASNIVRGTELNDIFTAGYNGTLWHYNGVNWKMYEDLNKSTDSFSSISSNKNFIVIAGHRYLNGIERYGLIVIGRR
jgi:hypothetical protein